MKGIRKNNAYIVCIVIVYLMLSLFLLFTSKRSERETTIYAMEVIWEKTSEQLLSVADYRQYFYAPCNCSGIQLGMATDQTEAESDLIIYIYDATSDTLLGQHVITCNQIKDNQYADLMFESYILEEGKAYYFETTVKEVGENPLRFWMGKSNSRFCKNATYQNEIMPETSIAFNLIYDYTDKHFIIWMFMSVLFLLTILKITEVEK